MKKGKKAATCAALAVMILTGCGKGAAEDPAPHLYEDRMIYAGGEIWIDTETGVCYWRLGNHMTVLLDRNGDPYIANGWRDYGGTD